MAQVLIRTSPSPSRALYQYSSEPNTDSDGGIVLIANDERYSELGRRRPREKGSLEAAHHRWDLQTRRPNEGINWCGRGCHVDFGADEHIPLRRGRLLGHGSQGGVYETSCKGMRLAWKIKYCQKKVNQINQRREVEVLKRMSHRHVVKLVGTYTQGVELGLLIWPVAVCDLATFMDDIDVLRGSLTDLETGGIENSQMLSIMGRLGSLCPETDSRMDAYIAAVARLSACFGCLIGAIDYVHGQRIRHKDIKPHNILLSHDGLWLADFGISSDFSAHSNSQSEAIERGTLRYFAPEVAVYEKSGRAADIFSLGCIFLEMIALIKGVPLEELKASCPEQRGSFQGNLQHKHSWFKLLKTRNTQLQHLLCEMENMMEKKPNLRPSAHTLDKHLAVISQLGKARSPLYGLCCKPEQLMTTISDMEAEIQDLRLSLRERDHYIDDLLELSSLAVSQSPLDVPRPPMGSNCVAMAPFSALDGQ